MRVLPVHWEVRNDDIRVASAAVIGTDLKHSALPCIVAGDFNSTPVNYPHAEPTADGQTPIFKLLAAGVLCDSGADRSLAPDLTFPSFAPTRTIDWILVSPDLRGRLRGVRTLESRLSDHRPVVGVVEVTAR